MTIIPISGADWRCGAATKPASNGPTLAQVEEWLPANVPGDVHSALLAAGRIADPFFGLNDEKCRWVEDLDWWYQKQFSLGATEGKRIHLVFEGIDYSADVYLNNTKLGHHEGMFARQVYEVTRLTQSENTIAVRLLAAAKLPKMKLSRRESLAKKLAKPLLLADLFPDRLATLKCQMSFGWDFAPRLLTSGIWDDVYLHLSDTVFIRDVFVRSKLDGEAAVLDVEVEIDGTEGLDCELVTTVEGANFVSPPFCARHPALVPAGKSTQRFQLRLPAPHLWQPWDRGEPCLYRYRLEVHGKDRLLDAKETVFGVRSVELVANSGAPRGSSFLTLAVNGEREFIRGANWVPADSLFARLRRADYAQLIALAKAANVNLFRVWGGGLREKKDFYDLCDAEGILVWQEFPLACAFFDHYPSDSRFLDLVRAEGEGIVRHLRNRPSLAIWCGGNEFSPAKNRKAVEAIKRAVDELDGSRPFLPASPGKGDGHNWRVWHGKANIRDYRADRSLLASEFGLQAAPDVSALARFLPPTALYPPGDIWEHHSAQVEKLNRYAAPFQPQDLASFVKATQRVQAIGLQAAVEHFRRRKVHTSGTIFWQFNEPWPAISWSVVDYFRQPKLAYHKLTDIYSPVLISLSYPIQRYRVGDDFTAEIWAINDLRRPFENCELRLFLGETVVHRQPLHLPPDSSRLVGQVNFTLRQLGELRIELSDGENAISRNSYDLTYFDPTEISRWDAIRHWIAWRVLK